MPDANRLHDRIAGLFAGALKIEVPAVHTDLFELGVLDSLAFVELLLHLEREFGITASIDDLTVENFRTIAHIAAFVQTRADGSDSVCRPRVVRLITRR
jgi:acyl carrier protein